MDGMGVSTLPFSVTSGFHDPANVGNLMSGSSAFSKTSLNIWKFIVHILLKPGLENFGHERAARCPPPFFAAWAATRV